MSPNLHNKVLVLTGTTGSGKSTAAQMFQDLGIPVVSADALAREVLASGSATLAKVIAVFGDEFLLENNELDRKKLGAVVFSSKAKRETLEQIVHPAVRSLADSRLADALEKGTPYVIYDCPLYFEAGLDTLGFGASVVIWAPEDLCIERLMQRDSLTEGEARYRLASQIPAEEKKERGTYVIDNTGNLQNLREQIKTLHEVFSVEFPPKQSHP